MNIFFIISYILLSIYTVASLTIQIISRRQSKHKFDLNQFDIKTLEATGQIKRKQEAAEKEQEKELNNKLYEKRLAYNTNLQNLRNEFEAKENKLRETFRDKNEAIHDDFIRRRKEYEELDTAARIEREAKMKAALEETHTKYSEALKAFKDSYQEKQQEIANELSQYKETIDLRKQELTAEIEKYENKQKEIIQRFKEDAAKREKAEFYRIQIKEEDKEDIAKLRQLAEKMNNPTVIYKLIWENYYKVPFTQMVGRVVPAAQKGIGIYKITNTQNGKCYVGQTKQDFGTRWRSHVRRGVRAEPGTMNKLYGEMWKEGVENFTFEILTACKPEELNEKEKYFIKFYQADEWGYNSTKGNN